MRTVHVSDSTKWWEMKVEQKRSVLPVVASVMVAFGWFFVTFIVSMEHAGYLDTIDGYVPVWLKVSDAVVWFPMDCVLDLNKDPEAYFGHGAAVCFFLLYGLNCLFWGFLLVFVCRWAIKFFTKRGNQTQPAAP